MSIKRSKRAPIVRLGNCQACLSATLHQSKLAAATHPPPPSAPPSLTESQRIKMHARRNRVTLLRKRLPRYSPIAAFPRAARDCKASRRKSVKYCRCAGVRAEGQAGRRGARSNWWVGGGKSDVSLLRWILTAGRRAGSLRRSFYNRIVVCRPGQAPGSIRKLKRLRGRARGLADGAWQCAGR